MTMIAVGSISAAIEAAGHKPPAVLLVEPVLLENEDSPIGERLDRRADRAVRIIALASDPTDLQRVAARRHGASFLLRPPGDFHRIADLLLVHMALGEASAEEPAALLEGRGEGPVILVVDDSATARTLVARLLAARGYRVFMSINASNALRFLSMHEVDLVISDLTMPHMDGFELKHEIDRIRSKPIPFVMITAQVTSENLATALRLGSSGFLPKPILPEALYETVAAVLAEASRSR